MNMENDLSSKVKLNVRSADTEMYGRVRLSSYVNYFIHAAILSAEKLGFGWDSLRDHSLFWVLSRLTIEMNQIPVWKEDIEIETWPKRVEKILYIRDFLARDSSGEIIARATSGWLAVDIETKRPKVVSIMTDEQMEIMNKKNAIIDLPEKIIPASCLDSEEIKTSYFDFDMNGHVTSTRYIDMMMDKIGIEKLREVYPKRLSINHLTETLPGDSIYLSIKDDENGLNYFEGINKKNGLPVFRSIIQF